MPGFETDLFRFTSGRWLWNEEQQLRNRYTPFNVSELKKIAAHSIGADTCTAITKLAEGYYNRCFRVEMNNGSAVIARIPYPIAGPRYYTTASEVATMDFARTILGIPTPRVYSWDADMDNSVGSEYIIMEEAPGTMVQEVWEDLSVDDKIEFAQELAELQAKLLKVPLNCYGSLYYATANIKDAVPAETCAAVTTELRDEIRRRFVIGPVASRGYWNKERATMALDRGPWKQPQDYLLSLAQREEAWIRQYATTPSEDRPQAPSATQHDPDSHIALLHKFIEVAPHLLPDDPDLKAPYLWHTDLHAANLFVRDGKISSVIDWQGQWIVPLMLQGRPPKMIYYDGEMILRKPENFGDLDAEEKSRIRECMHNSILYYLYQVRVNKRCPILFQVFEYPHGRTRLDPIHVVGNTWDNDIVRLRGSVIMVERYWESMGFDIPCPIHFTEEEVHHCEEEEGEIWNKIQDFWDSAAKGVNREGFTSHACYDGALTVFRNLREACKNTAEGIQREMWDKQARWVEQHHRTDS
ncbi:phosphotransferase enzyme [Aspergillus brasiliensis]|nr:phosphotransferase enzyme [Aspergillus brasiliensis]